MRLHGWFPLVHGSRPASSLTGGKATHFGRHSAVAANGMRRSPEKHVILAISSGRAVVADCWVKPRRGKSAVDLIRRGIAAATSSRKTCSFVEVAGPDDR